METATEPGQMKTLVQMHDCLLFALAGRPVRALAGQLEGSRFQSPLVVGDRLDTDIARARDAGLPSLLVMTGVSTASDVVHASHGQRPTYIARDLSGLHDTVEAIAVAEQSAWRVDVGIAHITVTSTGADPGTDGLSVVRALAYALWQRPFRGSDPMTIGPGDDAAWVALHRWALLPEAESVTGRVRSASERKGRAAYQ